MSTARGARGRSAGVGWSGSPGTGRQPGSSARAPCRPPARRLPPPRGPRPPGCGVVSPWGSDQSPGDPWGPSVGVTLERARCDPCGQEGNPTCGRRGLAVPPPSPPPGWGATIPTPVPDGGTGGPRCRYRGAAGAQVPRA
jgi:hypothetical protein